MKTDDSVSIVKKIQFTSDLKIIINSFVILKKSNEPGNLKYSIKFQEI